MSEETVLLCARVEGELYMLDNRTGPCSECWHLVQYRPHAPKHARLVCMQCAASMIGKVDRLTTTPRMIEDAKTYFRKKLQ